MPKHQAQIGADCVPRVVTKAKKAKISKPKKNWRRMLAEDIRLDLIGRIKLQGRQQVDDYFTRYAEAGHWRYALGTVEGRQAVLVYDQRSPTLRPADFVLLEWNANGIATIKDYLFAPYVLDEVDWTV